MADDEATARRTTKAAAAGPARKPAAKKSAVAKAPVAKAPAKRAPAKKGAISKAAAGKSAAAAPRQATGKKAPAKRAGARDAGAVLAPRKKAAPPLRLAAEQTFDDDPWREPEPEPVREDPSARVRGILRAAALSLEAKERGATPVARTLPPPEEPVTQVLVSPAPHVDVDDDMLDEAVDDDVLDDDVDDDMLDEAVADDVLDDDMLDDEVEEDHLAEPEAVDDLESDDEEWSAPEVLDEPAASDTSPPPPPSQPPSHDAPPAATTQIIVPPAPAPTPEKKKSRRGLRVLLVVLALGVAAAAVFAVLALRDEGIDYSKLKVGDCFSSSQSNELRGINVEPCSEPHNSEIFFLVQHPAGPDDPYPGKDALVQFAADACLGQPLTEYLGVPLEQSSLKDFEIVPQESAWKDGRRVLVCGVDTGGGEDITGSVKGTRR